MDRVGLEVGFEGLEVCPRPSLEELVLDAVEDLLRSAVVDAVALGGVLCVIFASPGGPSMPRAGTVSP